MKRLILEMGMGVDVHGQDYTKAAKRAIHDALRHSSLSIFGTLKLNSSDMDVRATIGVQRPEALDVAALEAEFPRGRAVVTPVFGGQDVLEFEGGPKHIIATAAIEAFYPLEPGDWVRSSD